MKRNLFLVFIIAMLSSPTCASAQMVPASEIAPTGKLRGAVIGIRVLGGIGEPIGRFIAEKLGVPFEFAVYPNPQAYEARANGILRSDHACLRLRTKPT